MCHSIRKTSYITHQGSGQSTIKDCKLFTGIFLSWKKIVVQNMSSSCFWIIYGTESLKADIVNYKCWTQLSMIHHICTKEDIYDFLRKNGTFFQCSHFVWHHKVHSIFFFRLPYIGFKSSLLSITVKLFLASSSLYKL